MHLPNNYKKIKIKRGINLFNFNEKSRPGLAKAAKRTLLEKKYLKLGVVNVVLVGDKEIKRLNKKYRKVNRVTDVISFLENQKPLFGDIYIAKERSKRQALQYGHTWQEELMYLVIHGILHLFGNRDYLPAQRKKMFSKQDKIFKVLVN
ncbi:MAG: rRNA maturation RNase YbeY [Elusimicrobia bacterium]|nr:rRNA maturation RNase YbeY [Candidatus Liberimonas magnetica]